MTDENVVPIVDGRPITCSKLEVFIQTLGIKFQEYVDQIGEEPNIMYVALAIPEGPVMACIDISQGPTELRHSDAQAKVYFHLQHQLTNYIYKI